MENNTRVMFLAHATEIGIIFQIIEKTVKAMSNFALKMDLVLWKGVRVIMRSQKGSSSSMDRH